MGGLQFLISSSLSMNGCGIDLHSLADTGANGFLFINHPLAKWLSKLLGTPIQNLPYTILVGGFNGKTQISIYQFIHLHLTIDSWQIRNSPFIILNMGHQDVIIGIKWMRCFKVILDPKCDSFWWPSNTPLTPNLAKEIKLPYHPSIPTKFPNYQTNANCHNYKLELQI